MNLPSKPIPTVDEDDSLRGHNRLGVVDCLPGKLGEGLAIDKIALLHGTEAVLLAVARVPDPVPEEVADEEGRKSPFVPAVLLRGVVGEVEGAVAVGQRNTS